jgi:hypothetical protein
MRFLLAFLSCFFLIIFSCEAYANFSGSWAIDLKASTSPESLLKRLQIPFVQRRLAASIKIEAVYKQSPEQLVIRASGPGFSRTEQIQINGPPEARTEKIIGSYTIQTRWSAAGSQLITTYNFRTKDGKNAVLIVNRSLADAGATLVLNGTMQVEGEPQKWVVRRVWRKVAN